jgi:hypothetical protein
MYLNIKGIRMKKTNGLIGCLLLLILVACKKETSNNNSFTPYTDNPLNDTAWIKTITGDAPIYKLADTIFQKNAIVDSIDLTKDIDLTYGDSLEVEIHAGSCGNGSAPQDGKAKIEILRLQTRGDFIKAYRPNNSFGYPLETGGGFFVRITKNGVELTLNPGASIKIKYLDIAPALNNMQVFYGKESIPFPVSALDSAHTWKRDADTSYIKTFVKQSGTAYKIGYELNAIKLRWISAHRYLDSNVAKTNIYAILPPNCTNKNTQVFAVFDKSRTVLALRSDLSTRSFTTSNIPLRSKITLVTISKIGADLYLGTKVINDVGTVVNYTVTPEKKSLGQILDYINAL